jgi:protein-S-isoprenylcysteine O-methyltransferase Ste14/uncharacterized membrane protein (UPF0127 family)
VDCGDSSVSAPSDSSLCCPRATEVTEAVPRAWAAPTGALVVERLRLAHTHWTRLKGLLGTKGLGPGDGLWLKPCRQVHMLGMRYAVDVVFLDAQNRIVRMIAGLAPNRISPSIAEAASVLELPLGTIASAGLHPGTQIEIEGALEAAQVDRVDIVAAAACNLALAAFYGFFAVAHFGVARRTGQWATTMPIVGQEALLVLLFLTRRRSIATSTRLLDWVIGSAGTLLPMLLRPAAAVGALNWLGAPMQIVGLVLAITGLAFLGRSVAVVAGNRGVKTAGLYRVVRHPMYAAYIVTYTGYLASYPTLRNGMLVIATIVLLNARAIAEERFLLHDSGYRQYLRHVRWRFVPYVY